MIEPIQGEPGRYYAHSQTNRDDCYIVDLSESLPKCSCTDFTVRRLHKLLENWQIVKTGEGRNVCKHILEAMQYKHVWEEREERAAEFIGRLAIIGNKVGRVVGCRPVYGLDWPEYEIKVVGMSLLRITAHVVRDNVRFARSWAEAETMKKGDKNDN